jgi:heat shock protein HspQ
MFKVGDIVKHKLSNVHGVIVKCDNIVGENYKVFWFDENIQKENYDISYPAYFMTHYIEKVSDV